MSMVMGTAGHIDHGKTSLVKSLTGTDCDRLREEKLRGITIELGFAELALPDGTRLSVVDVPGHERFIRTMAAGAAGVDFVLLVIAADEGVMPQTREHLEICSLLGISHGLVALTKVDMVSDDLLELALDDVSSYLQGTFLEGAPIFPVSSHTGQGMDALLQGIAEARKTLPPVRRSDLLRLPVDRAFTMHGHGTVVTGTLLSGGMRIGDSVSLYPSGLTAKVRGLQSHGESAETAASGRRTAVNLAGIGLADVQRGDVLAAPGELELATRWVLQVTCLESSPRPLRHRAEVHLHHGARELQARLYFPGRDRLQPGETALCEARFTEPAVAVYGDRCVIRSFSPLRTVAGGVVLHPLGFTTPRTRESGQATVVGRAPGLSLARRSPNFAAKLAALAALAEEERKDSSGEERVRLALELSAMDLPDPEPSPPHAGTAGKGQAPSGQAAPPPPSAALKPPVFQGLSFRHLRLLTGLDSRLLDKHLAALSTKQQAVCYDKDERVFAAISALQKLCAGCLAAVGRFHAVFPEKQGVRRGELASGWGRALPPKLLHFVLERLTRKGELAANADLVFLPDHAPTFSEADSQARDAVLAAHTSAGFTPPGMREVLENLGVEKKQADRILTALRENGDLVRIADGLWYASAPLAELEDRVRAWFASHPTLSLAEFKEITGLSRKYLVALLEYFDAKKLTERAGESRKLRK